MKVARQMSELMNHMEDLCFNQKGGRVDPFHRLLSIFTMMRFSVCREESNFSGSCRIARAVRREGLART